MKIILSIMPFYAEKILDWEKLYELRRSFSDKEISKVIVYECAPVSKIVGEFEIEKILYESLENLRKNTKSYSCIDKEFFDKYFEWKEYGYAIKIRNPKRYKNSKLISDFWFKRPPQAYYII